MNTQAVIQDIRAHLQKLRLAIELQRLQAIPEWVAMERVLRDFVIDRTTYAMNPETPIEEVPRARTEIWMASWFQGRVKIPEKEIPALVDKIAGLRNQLQVVQDTDPAAVPDDVIRDASQLLNQFPQVTQWNRKLNFVS